MRIGVADDVGTAHGRVEAHDTRAEERLYPAGVEVGAGGQDEVVYPRNKLRLDALRLDGGNGDDGHTLLLKFLTDFLLLVEVSLVCFKVVVARLAYAGISGVRRAKIAHPIVVINILAQLSKCSFPFR